MVVVEAEHNTLWSLVKKLHSSDSDNAPVSHMTVLASTEDISDRVFNMSYSTFLNEASGTGILIENSEGLIKIASEVNIAILKLGEKLSILPEEEAEEVLANVRTQNPSFPTQETVAAIIEAEDSPSVDDFIEIFGKPVDVCLDSELAWPVAD